MMVRHAAVALACLALAHAIAAPAAFCPKVLEPLDRTRGIVFYLMVRSRFATGGAG